ncbi:MAG: ImmA/IrrE family metallo-endopeptidase [Ruminococcus flavefaciens]|nr:ImmA/IrrE family metallo-endopeptidase [Ruminococcus flavefaciens]
MSNIIKLENYTRRKGDIMELQKLTKCQELLNHLEKMNADNHEYSLVEIRNIANNILSMMSKNYSGRCATPIVKIAKLFDFKTYKEYLNESGDININGTTKEKYGHDKVILVNRNEELYHQRFVVAHELAHYLFDFLGNSTYTDKNILFADTYEKDKHETPQEKRANTFAAEIMMPKELFIQQYNIARREEKNHMFIVMYLSRYFETSIESIEKRIKEVSR